MSQAPHKISVDLRAALLGADHVLADRLVKEYAQAAREVWESLPESERAASSLPQQASELLTWAHEMTVVRRAMAGAQLAVVQKAAHYSSVNRPTQSVQFRG
jgi:hypothetical protein